MPMKYSVTSSRRWRRKLDNQSQFRFHLKIIKTILLYISWLLFGSQTIACEACTNERCLTSYLLYLKKLKKNNTHIWSHK
jgi:hypothetical protein